MITVNDIDALLPQTQCGLCGYPGCKPYAEALANSEAPINLCPPGGVQGLLALADLLKKDPTPFIEEMKKKSKPTLRAVIRESECIGCTKCIQACPVDAILGSGKLMHTVIASECTGCELCVAPCPVDCIDMIPISLKQDKKDYFRNRYDTRNIRLQKTSSEKKTELKQQVLQDKKAYIEAALLRAQEKQRK